MTAEPDWYGAEPKQPPRTWDFLLTSALVVFMLVLVVVFAVSSLGFGVLNQVCADAAAGCSPTRIQIGQLICTFAPGAIALIAIVWSLIRVFRRRIAFWLAALGAALMVAAFQLGNLIMTSGLPVA
ncbi:MAG: DUF6264 family protein [Microbacteriaceae bacterium]